jgi:hypothetical protein
MYPITNPTTAPPSGRAMNAINNIAKASGLPAGEYAATPQAASKPMTAKRPDEAMMAHVDFMTVPSLPIID